MNNNFSAEYVTMKKRLFKRLCMIRTIHISWNFAFYLIVRQYKDIGFYDNIIVIIIMSVVILKRKRHFCYPQEIYYRILGVSQIMGTFQSSLAKKHRKGRSAFSRNAFARRYEIFEGFSYFIGSDFRCRNRAKLEKKQMQFLTLYGIRMALKLKYNISGFHGDVDCRHIVTVK